VRVEHVRNRKFLTPEFLEIRDEWIDKRQVREDKRMIWWG